jgi:hypothetical protein
MASRRQRLLVVAVLLFALHHGLGTVVAHDLERTFVAFSCTPDGSFVLEVRNDPTWLLMRLESFAGGAVPAGMTPEARDARLRELSTTFVDRIVLFASGREVRPTGIEYVPPPLSPDGDSSSPALATFRLTGTLPPGTETMRWLYGLVIDPYPLTIRTAGGSIATEWINGSDWSGIIALTAAAPRRSRLEIAREYLHLGYTHILPKGLDHILFVLGLFLLNVRLRPVLLQVTTFTIAHSLTLAMSMYGVLSLPSRIVEPLIALSIAYVAIENLMTSRIKPWRLGLVFGFGLLHGLGFAGVLADLELPREEFLTALLSFNLGVEAGQLTVIALAAGAVVWTRDRAWYRRAIVTPASLVIAAVGIYWTVARAF